VSPALRARRFLAGRVQAGGAGSAAALDRARRQHLAMEQAASTGAGQAEEQTARTGAGIARPRGNPINPLSAAWQAVGPMQIASQSYGNVTGRVTSVAIDATDPTGNTVYLGTTGGR
jgi:hypothetical protein